MILTDAIFGKRKKVNSAPNFIFDTSGYRSNESFKKFKIKRSTDNIIAQFSTSDIHDGSYTAWLNGASGIITEWIDQESGIILKEDTVYGGPVFLDTTGKVVDSDLNGNLWCDNFDVELNDFMVSMLFSLEANGSNGRCNLSIVGNNPEADGCMAINQMAWWNNLPVLYQDVETGHSDCLLAIQRQPWNLVVIKKSGGVVTEALYNGSQVAITTAYRGSDVAIFTQARSKAIQLGRGKDADYKHIGIWTDMRISPATIMSELNAIHEVY